MKYAVRAVGLAIFAYAIVLSIELVWALHDGQYNISLGLALLALAVSATGLVIARYSWQCVALPECGLGVALWLVGATFFGITELNYWSGSYAERHAQYTKHKAAEARQEGLTDKDWKALTTGEMPPTPGEIEARINAAKMHERWGPSKGCTDATVAESKAFCSEYFALEAQLAGAKQREQLEERLLAATSLAATPLTFNVFAIADQLTRWFHIEERQATDIVVVAAWLLLMLCRDGGLLLAFPAGRRKEAAMQAEAKSEPEVQTQAVRPLERPDLARRTPFSDQAFDDAVADMMERSRQSLIQHNMMVRALEAKPEPSPPTGGGTPVATPKPEEQSEAVAAESHAENVVGFPTKSDRNIKSQKAKYRKAKANRHGKTGRVVDWLSDATSQTTEARTLSKEAYANYDAWCDANGLHAVAWRQFTKKAMAALKLKKKRDGKTGQQIFPVVLSDPAQWQARAVA
jgi:hypothetical protein